MRRRDHWSCAGHSALMRGCRGQPADCGVAHAVGARNVHQRFAGIAAGDSLAALVRRQLRWPPHMNPLSLRPGAAFPGPGPDQLSLKFGQAAQHRQHQAPVRRGSVGPGLGSKGRLSILTYDKRPGGFFAPDSQFCGEHLYP